MCHAGIISSFMNIFTLCSPLFKIGKCKLVIIQCDMGYVTDDLIACARHRIYDMRAKVNTESSAEEATATHVLFIVYLPVQTLQSSLIGYQGEPWISAHVDEIRQTSEGNLTVDIAQGVSISKLFYGPLEDSSLIKYQEIYALKDPPQNGPNTQVISSVSNTIDGPTTQEIHSVAGPNTQVISSVGELEAQIKCSPTAQEIPIPSEQIMPSKAGPATQIMGTVATKYRKAKIPPMYTQCRRLHVCIQAAASFLVQLTPDKKWATKRVELLTELIPEDPTFPIIGKRNFYFM